jgi:hypothetical protein
MEDPQKSEALGKMGTDPESCVQDSRPRSPINGQPLPVGRQKGQVNKLTKTFKAAAEAAFEKGGGVDWLVKMMNGTASDRAAVLGLFGRLIPHQLVGQVDHKVKVELSWLGGRSIGKVIDMQSPAPDQKAIEHQDVTDLMPNQTVDMRLPRDSSTPVGGGQAPDEEVSHG